MAQRVQGIGSEAVGHVFNINTLHLCFCFSKKLRFSIRFPYSAYFYCNSSLCHYNGCCKNQGIDLMPQGPISPFACQALLLPAAAPYQTKLYYNNNNNNNMTATKLLVVIMSITFIQGHVCFLVANVFLIIAVFNDH